MKELPHSSRTRSHIDTFMPQCTIMKISHQDDNACFLVRAKRLTPRGPPRPVNTRRQGLSCD